MHFSMKSYLKSTGNHTTEKALKKTNKNHLLINGELF